MIRGRVAYVDDETIWLARGARLLFSDDGGSSWHHEARLPVGFFSRLMCATRLSRRLARAGIHHLLPEQGLVFASGHIYRREMGATEFCRVEPIRGSRPLGVATDGKTVLYGEYRDNGQRSPIHIWATDDAGATWSSAYEFRGVRHVHGVYYDDLTDSFWITTGDEDDESAIWVTRDRFATVDLVVGGSQQTRAIQLCFTADCVYFGSDTPRAQNYLYRLHRQSGQLEQLQRVGSSVFYGWQTRGRLFFSTAAEPSSANRADRAEIWHSVDGDRWHLLEALHTDRWPPRLFQYGQVLFPRGPGDGKHLFYTPQGTRGDGSTVMISLDQVSSLSTHG